MAHSYCKNVLCNNVSSCFQIDPNRGRKRSNPKKKYSDNGTERDGSLVRPSLLMLYTWNEEAITHIEI